MKTTYNSILLIAVQAEGCLSAVLLHSIITFQLGKRILGSKLLIEVYFCQIHQISVNIFSNKVTMPHKYRSYISDLIIFAHRKPILSLPLLVAGQVSEELMKIELLMACSLPQYIKYSTYSATTSQVVVVPEIIYFLDVHYIQIIGKQKIIIIFHCKSI